MISSVLPVDHKVDLSDHALPVCPSFASSETEVFALSAKCEWGHWSGELNLHTAHVSTAFQFSAVGLRALLPALPGWQTPPHRPQRCMWPHTASGCRMKEENADCTKPCRTSFAALPALSVWPSPPHPMAAHMPGHAACLLLPQTTQKWGLQALTPL